MAICQTGGYVQADLMPSTLEHWRYSTNVCSTSFEKKDRLCLWSLVCNLNTHKVRFKSVQGFEIMMLLESNVHVITNSQARHTCQSAVRGVCKMKRNSTLEHVVICKERSLKFNHTLNLLRLLVHCSISIYNRGCGRTGWCGLSLLSSHLSGRDILNDKYVAFKC